VAISFSANALVGPLVVAPVRDRQWCGADADARCLDRWRSACRASNELTLILWINQLTINSIDYFTYMV
jgi:hypothetical protein